MAMDVVRGDSPLFRRISSNLAEAISRGDYPVGGQLPPEFTLMRMFGASRFTIREALESVDEFRAGIVQAPITTLDITDVVADSALAAQLRCEAGRQVIMLRGERRRWGHPEEPPIALVRGYVNAVYGLIRPELAKPSEALASIAERALNVRVQRIVQELQPIALDADEAASLAAPVGSPAILVWRWYYLDNDDLIIIARSTYPQGRMVFRTELMRSGPQAGNG